MATGMEITTKGNTQGIEADLHAILQVLPKLGKDELEKIKARASALLALGVSASPMNGAGKRDDVAICIDAICEAMSGLGLGELSPHWLRKTASAGFAEKVTGLNRWMGKAGIADSNRRRALIVLGIEMLCRDIDRMGLPSSPKFVMAQIHRLPSLFNRSFPGYAQAGLLGLILRKEN
jgi:hypothetical protein